MPASNTLATATQLHTSATPLQITGDSVTDVNGSDFYRFGLSGRSSLSLSVDSLTPNGDVNVEIFTNTGAPLTLNGSTASSQNNGNLLDTIHIDDLAAGSYYIRVYTDSPVTAEYNLNLQSQQAIQTNLLWRNVGTGTNAGRTDVWLMDNTKLTQSMTLTTPSAANLDWQIEGVGDFNSDGQMDLLRRNVSTGINAGKTDVWLMKGNTFFQSVSLSSQVTSSDWQIETIADFNHDGQTDLLWRNVGTGANAGRIDAWLMNGTTVSQSVTLSAPKVANRDWRVEGVGDFNTDGQFDLVWRYAGAGAAIGKTDIWLMNGFAVTQSVQPSVQVNNLNWQIEAVGDFNSDGKSDLLWRNVGTGVDAGRIDAWLMDGVKMGQSVTLSQRVTAPDWQVEGVQSRYNTPPHIDVIGNAINSALNIGTLNSQAEFVDFVSNSDLEDYYQFTVQKTGNYELSITGMSGDASLELLDTQGAVIGISDRSSISAEAVVQTLSAGMTYYARVFSSGNLSTNYKLSFDTSFANINAPIVNLSGTTTPSNFNTTFIGNGGAVAIVNPLGFTISDSDSTNLASAVVTIKNLFDGAAERLAVDLKLALSYGISSNYNDGLLTLTGNATLTQYQELLRTITYNNTSQNPNTTARVIDFVAYDGLNDSSPVSSIIQVIPG